MLSQLLSALTRKRDEIIVLNIGSGGSPPGVPKSYVPNQRVLIGKETDSHISIKVTERQSEDRMMAEVTVSFPFVKGTCQAELRTGELRRFASDIDKVQHAQAGVAQLTIIPGCLLFNILFDENRQLIVAVRYRRIPALAVDTISKFSLNLAELPTIIDRLHATDPGK